MKKAVTIPFMIIRTGTFVVLALLFGFIGGAFGSAVFDNIQLFESAEKSVGVATPNESTETRQVVEESTTTDVVNAAKSSVVSIVISKEIQTSSTPPIDPFFDDFFDLQIPEPEPSGPPKQVEVGGGTGFVISEDGLIATNRHVVSDAEASYTVIFDDETSYDAEVLAVDQLNDFAILKIDANELTPLPLGDSDNLVQGQTVIAIGNTVGEYDNTVTKGVVSGLNRNLGGEYSGLIQTDAAINQGNSGGPLLNLEGRVVGINTAVDRSGEGIGFAIPINQATVAIESVKEHGRIVRAALGVRYVPINKEISEANGLAVDYGAFIRGDELQFGVVAGSAADTAGLKEGDIILEVDGTKVDEENQLSDLIRPHVVGDVVILKILRDGEEQEVSVTLEELPSEKKNEEEE